MSVKVYQNYLGSAISKLTSVIELSADFQEKKHCD